MWIRHSPRRSFHMVNNMQKSYIYWGNMQKLYVQWPLLIEINCASFYLTKYHCYIYGLKIDIAKTGAITTYLKINIVLLFYISAIRFGFKTEEQNGARSTQQRWLLLRGGRKTTSINTSHHLTIIYYMLQIT